MMTNAITHYGARFMMALAVLATASCGSELTRTGKAPAYLVIDQLAAAKGALPGTFATPLLSDVQTIVDGTPTVFNDLGRATIRAELKSPLGPTAATPLNAVTLTRYRVTFRRADGRNTPGVDLPYGFDGAVTATVSVGQSTQVVFDLVRHQNKLEPPLRNLINRGGLGFITVIAEVTFYGRDQAGNGVSISGSLDVQFGDFADD
jgi:hypothetical protein